MDYNHNVIFEFKNGSSLTLSITTGMVAKSQ